MRELITEARNQIARQVSKHYEDFVFSLLKPFGVTDDNWREWIGRITIVSTGDCNRHFYIDDRYVFTIIEEPVVVNMEDRKNDDGIIEFTTRYMVEVFESMIEKVFKED